MPPDVFALMLMAVMLTTALPAWAWWAAADDAGPDAQPDPRLQAAALAFSRPAQPALRRWPAVNKPARALG